MHATSQYMYYLPSYEYVNNIWWRVTDMNLTAKSFATLYSYLPLTSNILLSTLLSQNINLFSSHDVRHQISHSHKMTETIQVL
jgi:aminoglycoside N3'-acetyltransferase